MPLMPLSPIRYLQHSMATRKKTSAPKKTGAGSKSSVKGKPRSSGKKGVKPGFLGEVRKICIGIAILLGICLTAAMVADLYFHPGSSKSPGALLTDSSPQKGASSHGKKKTVVNKAQGHSAGKPVHEVDRKQKKESLKEKPGKSRKPEKLVLPKVKETPAREKGTVQEKTKTPKYEKTKGKPPVYEVFPGTDSGHPPMEPKPSRKPGSLPKIVVIIDDIGFDKKTAMGLCHVDNRITFSVLPGAPFGKILADRLADKGAQIMLHLPMEPMGYPGVDPGPGALFTSMTPDELLAQLQKDLVAIPHIVGVNNHMGSRLTTSESQMNQVFTILKKEDLFFIDSRTSVKSKCAPAARLLQIPFAQRDVFLDNVQNVAYITKQFGLLVKIAKKHGSAIGIGHPYKETLAALSKEIPKLAGKVEIVPAGTLVHILK